jgi:hypothetical protein
MTRPGKPIVRDAEASVTRRVLAFLILNLAGLLVIAGAFYDLFVPTVPPNHLSYLDVTAGQLDERIAALDLGMLRAIGGCLLAIGITALILTNGPIRRGEGWARLTLLVLVGVSECVNAYQMYLFGSPWYAPLTFVALTGLGVALAGAPSQGQPKAWAPHHEPRRGHWHGHDL